MPEFRVGVMGCGGQYSRYLPYPQYSFPQSAQWGERLLEEIWTDFAGAQRGILMTIWDATRLTWIGMPQALPGGSLRDFLMSKPFQTWGYFPVDSHGPSGGLSSIGASTVRGFDRVLAYSRFGAEVLSRSVGREVDWAPHGIDLSVFKPWSQEKGRAFLSQYGMRFFDGDVVLGVVATNQARKDWGLVAQVCHNLQQHYGPRFKAWWHTDVLERSHAWDMRALIADFGLSQAVLVTAGQDWKDRDLALAYSACNVTLAPGMEGFGYPIAESMACGIPVVTGDEHGGTELVPWRGGRVAGHTSIKIEGIHNCLRTVHDFRTWTDGVLDLANNPPPSSEIRSCVEHLAWDSLWSGVFKKWFLAGVPKL